MKAPKFSFRAYDMLNSEETNTLIIVKVAYIVEFDY